MKSKQFISNKILRSISLRIVGLGILWSSWYRDISLPHIEWWLLIPLYLGMREVLVHTELPVSMSTRSIRWKKLEKARQEGKISLFYNILFVNRIYLFPVLLTIYLSYLLVLQTGLFGWDYSILFLTLDEQLLLVLTIVSGIGMVIQEEKDTDYIHTQKSVGALRGYVLLGGILGVLGGYIVLQQTLSLGLLGIGIANLAGLLIFFVGLLLVDEE